MKRVVMEADPYEITGSKKEIQRKGSLARKIIGALVVLAILFVFCGLFVPNFLRYDALYYVNCSKNLDSIGLALSNYEQTYGVFPPACTFDATGKPLHSWRTLILPFLEEKEIYDSIDLNKPWDDPVNLKVSTRMPKCYACPAKKTKPDHTYYQAVVTDKSAIQKSTSHSLKEITDGPGLTLLIFESSIEDAVPWMEPIDTDWGSQVAKFAKAKMPHPKWLHLLFCNFSFRPLPTDADPYVLEIMSTKADGENVPADFGM